MPGLREEMSVSRGDFWLIVLAIFFPPVSVGLKTGFCSGDFWLNFILWILLGIPGIIHGIYIVVKYPEARTHRYQRLDEESRVGNRDETPAPGPLPAAAAPVVTPSSSEPGASDARDPPSYDSIQAEQTKQHHGDNKVQRN